MATPRVVLDTNVLISALIFRGPINAFVHLWQQEKIHLLVSKDVLIEYLKCLSYPKFKLSEAEVLSLIEENILPFAEIVNTETACRVIAEDPEDDKFLWLAVDGRADFIVSGDKHLLSLGKFRDIPIIRPAIIIEKPISSSVGKNDRIDKKGLKKYTKARF